MGAAVSLIQPAQTNLLLDPTYAKAETERIFQPQLTMAREFVEEFAEDDQKRDTRARQSGLTGC
jgi:hypothetical protein